MSELIKTAEDLYRHPHHAFKRDFKDAYQVELSLLTFVQKQIVPFTTNPPSYSIDLEGGYNTSGDNFEELIASPLIQTRRIVGMGLISRSGDPFRFSFRVRDGQFGNAVEVSGYDDPLSYEGLMRQVEDRMKSLRPWYWFIFRGQFELAYFVGVMLFSSVGASWLLPTVNPDARTFFVGVTLLVVGGVGRRLLFKRVEFLDGLSKRYADRRSSWQKFVGVTVIAGTIIAVARDFMFPKA